MNKNWLKKQSISLYNAFLLTLVFLGSFFGAFTVFVLINAIMGTCWYLVGETGHFTDAGLGWQFVIGSFVISVVVFFKLSDELIKIKNLYSLEDKK